MTDAAVQSFDADDAARRLGQKIRARRRELDLSQQDLAALANVSVRFIHSLEHGKSTSRLNSVLAVLNALGIELTASPRGR